MEDVVFIIRTQENKIEIIKGICVLQDFSKELSCVISMDNNKMREHLVKKEDVFLDMSEMLCAKDKFELTLTAQDRKTLLSAKGLI